MKLNQREKILAGCVGGAVLLAALVFAWQFGFGGEKSYSDLETEFKKLTAEVERNKNRFDSARRASAKLDDWQRRALPAEVPVAHKLYQSWLVDVVKKSGFQKTKIDAINKQTHRGVGEELTYSIEGQATLQQLAHFLYEFYDAGHLHKITHLKITPQDKSDDLSINITVVGFSLADADRRDKLTAEKGKRLLLKSYDDYGKTIVDRNVFSPPKPPKETQVATAPKAEDKPPPPKFDHLEFTRITAITASDGQPMAWIETKTTGKSNQVREGDEISVETAPIKVLHIGVRDVELEIGGERRTIKLGQNLLGKP
jgi:hypothetical protein